MESNQNVESKQKSVESRNKKRAVHNFVKLQCIIILYFPNDSQLWMTCR